jgi:putative hydrolase of the HAD superfamily
MPALLIDVGGVLLQDSLTPAAAAWGARLGITPQAFLNALFAGNDDQILIGRVSEAAWWRTIADRLRIGEDSVAAIRADLLARRTWNAELVATLRILRARATVTVVSNAWPDIRTDLEHLDLADSIVLSCEAGVAKPDPRIFELALRTVTANPSDALFIDDTPGHVAAARSLGIAGHLHTDTAETLARIQRFVEGARRSAG